jgi:serine/threonine protein phosphatase 1
LIESERADLKAEFEVLPLLIEVETSAGLIGIVHADYPLDDWSIAQSQLGNEGFVNACLWSRARVTSGNDSFVDGVYEIIVGHTPVNSKIQLGNVVYIDTGAVFGREFTIIQIQ